MEKEKKRDETKQSVSEQEPDGMMKRWHASDTALPLAQRRIEMQWPLCYLQYTLTENGKVQFM